MRVLLPDCLYCNHERSGYGHRETKSSFQGGWRDVDKHAIGDSLRAGVTEDDLSEKALGAVCFDGLEVAHAILIQQNDNRRFACRRVGAVKGERNEAKLNKWRGPAGGEDAVYAGFAVTLDRIKASPEATGRALQSNAVA
jgi:hypothetical protein